MLAYQMSHNIWPGKSKWINWCLWSLNPPISCINCQTSKLSLPYQLPSTLKCSKINSNKPLPSSIQKKPKSSKQWNGCRLTIPTYQNSVIVCMIRFGFENKNSKPAMKTLERTSMARIGFHHKRSHNAIWGRIHKFSLEKKGLISPSKIRGIK